MSFLATSASGQEEHGGMGEAAPVHGSTGHGAASHGGSGHESHPNHFGGVIGSSIRLETDDSALTLGLEYARKLSPRWALAAYTELVSSSLERDVILAAGAVFYPAARFSLVLAPGIELASKDEEHDGEIRTEDETEFLLRLGAGYSFPITPTASAGPVVLADRVGDRWTLVLGLGMAVGF
jgi:hypothetical protein